MSVQEVSELQPVDDETYKSFIADGVVVLEFWAIWCGDSYLIKEQVEQMAAQFAGQAKFGRVDLDINQWSVEQAGVTQLPNVVYYKNGQIVDRIVGVTPEHILSECLQKYL